MTPAAFLRVLEEVYGPAGWPKPFHTLEALARIERGEQLRDAASAVGTTMARLRALRGSSDPVKAVLAVPISTPPADAEVTATQILGQLLLGQCAELAFEDIYKTQLSTGEFQIRDLRESRSDTDYRAFNGHGRPIFRMNIKFHGAQFRRAPELVGLQPEDCFALATYKIYSALRKQEQERLPFFFAIAGVPNLTALEAGSGFSKDHVHAVALVHSAPATIRKRDFEEAIVRREIARQSEFFVSTYRRIRLAPWYVLSARKADKLLRANLFDRVFALRIRGFARQFRGAELDMHFSLEQDLTPLEIFLHSLSEEGLQGIITRMERGEY
jgi:hypothetical protein